MVYKHCSVFVRWAQNVKSPRGGTGCNHSSTSTRCILFAFCGHTIRRIPRSEVPLGQMHIEHGCQRKWQSRLPLHSYCLPNPAPQFQNLKLWDLSEGSPQNKSRSPRRHGNTSAARESGG